MIPRDGTRIGDDGPCHGDSHRRLEAEGVARGTFFNLVAAALSAAAFVIWGTDVDARWLFAILGVALVALPVCAVATKRIAEAYEKRLVDAHETAEKKLSAGGRERKYSEEHVRVLHAALAELTAKTAQA